MSQFKFNVANGQYPLDAFATIAVASTVGYQVGEAVYQGASLAAATASAKVSRVIDSTHLSVKGVKGTFAASTATIGNKSTTSSNTAGSGQFSWGVSRTRDRNGSPTSVVAGGMSVDDRGFLAQVWSDLNHKDVVVTARLAASKLQDTDTSVSPTLTYGIPAAKVYSTGDEMIFTISSSEALSVAGAPRIAVGTVGSAETVYATYDAGRSSPMNLVFAYTVNETNTTAGQIASVAYNANSAVITDIGGGAVTPNLGSPTLTGIKIGAIVTYTIPADATYADGEVLTWRVDYSEDVVVVGGPRIAIATLGSAETVYAHYNSGLSTSNSTVFTYTLDSGATTAGQIVSGVYQANGGSITGVNEGALTPSFAGIDVTGIILA